jgi:hypothetical protein
MIWSPFYATAKTNKQRQSKPKTKQATAKQAKNKTKNIRNNK